jgi:hypothetical protein
MLDSDLQDYWSRVAKSDGQEPPTPEPKFGLDRIEELLTETFISVEKLGENDTLFDVANRQIFIKQRIGWAFDECKKLREQIEDKEINYLAKLRGIKRKLKTILSHVECNQKGNVTNLIEGLLLQIKKDIKENL